MEKINKKTQNQRMERLGEERLNNQGCLMRIVEYNNSLDIVVEFQDEHKIKTHTSYGQFCSGSVKNPYSSDIYGVGTVGIKQCSCNDKEYKTWNDMLRRCYSKTRNYKMTENYNDVTCCEEWLNFENFYEWLHSQSNFDKWKNGKMWNLDKDIIIKGNKMYSPETCCLVPHAINNLFTKNDKKRGNLPIGVNKHKNKNGYKFHAHCPNSLIVGTKGRVSLGTFDTPEEAFLAYKTAKESYIKQVAQKEYDNGVITKECYDAMMKYEVEITD